MIFASEALSFLDRLKSDFEEVSRSRPILIRDNLPPVACESNLIRLLKSNGLGRAQFACSKESTLGCE